MLDRQLTRPPGRNRQRGDILRLHGCGARLDPICYKAKGSSKFRYLLSTVHPGCLLVAKRHDIDRSVLLAEPQEKI